MRALTLKEFKELILEEEQKLYGLTDGEVEIYYSYYVIGRQSVRW